jgi:hypothetical protein
VSDSSDSERLLMLLAAAFALLFLATFLFRSLFGGAR